MQPEEKSDVIQNTTVRGDIAHAVPYEDLYFHGKIVDKWYSYGVPFKSAPLLERNDRTVSVNVKNLLYTNAFHRIWRIDLTFQWIFEDKFLSLPVGRIKDIVFDNREALPTYLNEMIKEHGTKFFNNMLSTLKLNPQEIVLPRVEANGNCLEHINGHLYDSALGVSFGSLDRYIGAMSGPYIDQLLRHAHSRLRRYQKHVLRQNIMIGSVMNLVLDADYLARGINYPDFQYGDKGKTTCPVLLEMVPRLLHVKLNEKVIRTVPYDRRIGLGHIAEAPVDDEQYHDIDLDEGAEISIRLDTDNQMEPFIGSYIVGLRFRYGDKSSHTQNVA